MVRFSLSRTGPSKSYKQITLTVDIEQAAVLHLSPPQHGILCLTDKQHPIVRGGGGELQGGQGEVAPLHRLQKVVVGVTALKMAMKPVKLQKENPAGCAWEG